MARSREHVFSGLWSRDRGCYWWVVEVIAGRVGANRLFAAWVVSIHVVLRCADEVVGLRSRSRLSSFALQSARALFPPLGSHLGLLWNLSVAGYDGIMACANGLEQVLTFA
jgi:hypothetical protein